MKKVPDALDRKYQQLRESIKSMQRVIVGFSGGVDSSLVVRVAYDELNDDALAVIGRSATLPQREMALAEDFARRLGVPYRFVETRETDRIKFRENPANRCYYCKSELYSQLQQIARTENYRYVLDGTNADDTGDFRPGMKALAEHSVRAPLLENGLTKSEVRMLAKRLGMSVWDKPAMACLSSRFPYGSEITTEKLLQVERAEDCIAGLGFRNFRVRHYGDTARIELPDEDLERALQPGIRRQIVTDLKELGFHYITLDLEGFRSGSMNEVIKISRRNGT